MSNTTSTPVRTDATRAADLREALKRLQHLIAEARTAGLSVELQGSGLVWVERRYPTQVRCTCQPSPLPVMQAANTTDVRIPPHAPSPADTMRSDALRDAVRAYLAAWDAFFQAQDTPGLISAGKASSRALTALRRLVEEGEP